MDTSSLCGRVDPKKGGGWDLEARITEHHLGHSCKKCVAKYREYLFYGRVYAALVELAGANPESEPEFTRYFADDDRVVHSEWRFQGKFGSGGKLHKLPQGPEVTCYPEDLDGRGELLRVVNERLRALWLEFSPPGV